MASGGDLQSVTVPRGEAAPRAQQDRAIDLIRGSLFGTLFVFVPVGVATACFYLFVRFVMP